MRPQRWSPLATSMSDSPYWTPLDNQGSYPGRPVLLQGMWCIDYGEEHNGGCMSLEVIGKAIITGHCDRCGSAGVLHNTRDDTGHKMLMCNQCIEKAREKGS
jgi:hypothetical protein